MEEDSKLILKQNIFQKEKIECYSELFDLEILKNIIKKENNVIELYTCFNCTKQTEYICKWCKENCHEKKYYSNNNHIKIKKMTNIQVKNIKNFNCICKQQNHNIKKNTSYTKIYDIINDDDSNFSSNNFCNLTKEIIKEIINNKDYEELFDLLFFLKENNIDFKRIFKYNDSIWNDLLKINNDKIKTEIILLYFEFYIYEYFIITDDNNKNNYKRNLLFWFYDKSLNYNNIINNYFIYDIINAKIKIINKLNIIQPISFLKENNIFVNDIFDYLLNSNFIFNMDNLGFLLWNLLIKYSSIEKIDYNCYEQFNIINTNDYKEESKFLLIKTVSDLEIFEDFLELGFTEKKPFINKDNNLLKRLLINMYKENNKYLFSYIINIFSNYKILSLNESNYNKDKLLFMLFFFSNKNKFSSQLGTNEYNFDINNILKNIDEYTIELQNKIDIKDKFFLYLKIEILIINVYKFHNFQHIEEEILDKFLNKCIKLINLIIKDKGKYFFTNSLILNIILKFIVNYLNLKNEIHLNYFFSYIDILKILPNTEIELSIRELVKAEIAKKKFKKENISLLHYFLINPEIEELSFLKTENYEYLFNEMSVFYLRIFEIKRIESLIKYFEDYDLNLTINELIKHILKNIINKKKNKFFVFSLFKIENKDNEILEILEKELSDMNNNNIISDIYILYFIKSILFFENKFFYLSHNVFMKFYEFLNVENNNVLEINIYNNAEIIKNKKIPFCVKSLLLKFTLQLGLSLKIDKFNKIFRPLTNKQEMIRKKIIKMDKLSSQEKNDFFYKNCDKDNSSYNFLGDKIYKEHYLVILNIFNLFNEILEELSKINVFEDNIPEALYEYCIVIIKGLKYLLNMLLNSYDIYSLYFKNFQQTVNNFFQTEEKFHKILKKQKKLNINNTISDKNDKMEFIKQFRLSLENYQDLINEKDCKNIYEQFLEKNNKSLFSKNEENFLCFFENNCYDNIKLEELNSYNSNNENENSKIFSNYKKLVDYTNNIKESDIIKILTSIIIKDKEIESTFFNIFINKFYISILSCKDYYILEYNELSVLIKIFKLNKEYINYVFNSQLSINTENGIKNFSKEEIPIAFMGKLIKSINYYCNYEITISNSFCNTKHENIISRYSNALIILLTIIADNFEEYIFNHYYDFTNNDCLESRLDNDIIEQNEEAKELLYNYNYICSPYECMLILYQKIYESLIVNYLYNEDNIRENQNNLLILFYSITNFLISFNPLNLEKHKNKISFLLNKFFKVHLNENILKFIDNPLYIDKINFKYNSDEIFIKSQLIRLFITFIQLNKEEMLFQSYLISYKYDITLFLINDLIKIIETKIKSHEDNEYVIIYKQNKLIYEKDSNSFYKFLNDIYKNCSLIELTDFSSLIFLYYKVLRILTYDYNYNTFKILFDDEKNENENVYFYSIPIFLQSKLNDINLKGVFKFLNSIYIEIDYRYFYEKNIKKLDENSLYIIKKHSFFMNPKCSILSIYFKEIFLDKVNRGSRLNKIDFLNYFIDIAVYDCIYKKNKLQINKYFKYFIDLNYKVFEYINVAFVTLENLFLLIKFHKNINLPIDEYNYINPNYNNIGYSFLWIIVMFHSLFLGAVLICWGFFYFYRYYFHCLRKFYERKKFLHQKLSIDEKVILYRKMFKNNTDFNKIKFNNFFPYLTKKDIIEIIFREILFLNHKSWALFTFLFTICYYFSSPFFLIVSWIYIGNFFPNLLNVFRSLKENAYLIFSVYFYSYALVYILTWAVFFFIPKFFTIEVANRNNEILDYPEAQCSSSFSCLLFFLNHAMSSGGYVSSNEVSFKNDVSFYLRKFFIEVIFFQLINWIFTNIMLALVTNAFETVGKQNKKNEYDKNTKCFICEINYKKCFDKNINFKEHCKKKHSIWNYIYFIVQILIKDECELNNCEKYIYNFLKNEDFNWLPYEGNDYNERYITPLIIEKI